MKAAELGDAEAQFCIAERYDSGWGVSENYEEAAKWYDKAAEQGHTDAMIKLGFYYHLGRGVLEDKSKAESLYKKALKKGNEGACFELGLLCRNYTTRKSEAIYWLSRYANYTLETTGEACPTAVKCIKELGGKYNPKKKIAIDKDYSHEDNKNNNPVGIENFNIRFKKLSDNVSWGITKDGTLLIKGSGYMPTLKKYPWTKKKANIKTIHIDEGITSISKHAFLCLYSVDKIIIPKTIRTIDEDAFSTSHYRSRSEYRSRNDYRSRSVYITDLAAWCTIVFKNSHSNPLSNNGRLYINNTSVSDITIPSNVSTINAYAFYGCTNISSVTITENVRNINSYAFFGCSALKKVNIYNGTNTIWLEAFGNCAIESLTLPNSVKTIGNWAFYNSLNKYSTLSVNNSVESIGKRAFANKNGEFNGTIINLPSWLTFEKAIYVGIAKESYRAYRPSAQEMHNKRHKYFDSKNYETALEYFLKGTQCENPSDISFNYVASCYLYAGWCYEDLNDYSNAIIMFEKAAEFGEKYTSSTLESCRKQLAIQKEIEKAKTEYDKGNFELAFEHYVKAYNENRTTTTANNLNIVPEYYEKKGDYNNALKYYNKIKSISVHHGNIYDKIAYCYEKMGDYNNALRLYNIISVRSNVDERIAYCYEKLGNINGAIGVYKSKAEGGNKEYQYKLGGLYEKAKNKNLAIFWYRKAAEQQHLKAEEALAKYGIYIEKQNNQNKGNSNHNNHNHSQEQKQQTYTPEYGVRDVWVNCFDCHGTGQCSYCKGTGWYIYTNRHGEYIGSYKCTICLGSGRCTYCNGSGGHYEKQQYQIR